MQNNETKIVLENGIRFYKKNEQDKIWWVDNDYFGKLEISFDKKKILNLFQDYPNGFTPEEKEIFDRENPYWANFFSDRK